MWVYFVKKKSQKFNKLKPGTSWNLVCKNGKNETWNKEIKATIGGNSGIKQKSSVVNYYYVIQTLIHQYYKFAGNIIFNEHRNNKNINKLRSQWENPPVFSQDTKYKIFEQRVDTVCRKVSASDMGRKSLKKETTGCTLTQLQALVTEIIKYKEKNKDATLICENYLLYMGLHWRLGWRISVSIFLFKFL